MPVNASLLRRLNRHFKILPLTGLLLLAYLAGSAKNYYFSAVTGNDLYTTVQAQSTATPWKSIAKLNSIFNTLVGGDTIFFKRGETFFGSVQVNSSGLINKSIVLTAYGAGANPVISGFATVSSWVADGNGIYKASAASLGTGATASLGMVTLNNVPQQIGRFPNANAANGGYLKYQTFTDTLGVTAIHDTSLTNTINWSGAEVVIRKKLWVLDRCKVTSHAGNTIYYANPEGSDYTCTNNYGYFFQNDVRTLDQLGEWYYNKTAAELKMYFGAVVPSAYTIKAATLDALVTIRNKKYLQFINLAFEGANAYGIFTSTSDFITVKNCSFTNIGGTAVYMESTSDITVEATSTYNCLNNAMQFACPTDSNITIKNCTVKRTGTIKGMGQSNGNSYKGISVDITANLLIENNRVDTTGYVAIEFDGSNVMVRYNLVNYFCYNKDDAGGIYTWIPQNPGDLLYSNRVIKNNIVMNGVGAPEGRTGTTLFATGIYLDGTIMNVDVVDNTVFNMGKNGIHCNNPVNINITGNTSFNNQNAISFMRWPWATIRDLRIKNNIFYPKTSTQQNLYYTNAALNEPVVNTLPNVLQTLGSIDSNYHNSINPTGFSYEVYGTSGAALIPYSSHSIEGWRSFSGNDTRSKRPFREVPTYYLRNTIGANTVSNGSFNSGISSVTSFGAGIISSWDNTGKITGGALKLEITNPVANRYVLLYSTVGAVSSAKKYVLRFKTLGTTAFGIVRTYLRKTGSPYNNLTPVQVKVFDATVKLHEFLMAAPTTENNASYVIEIELNSGTTYLDDVEFYEANADVYNVDDYLRFEYNATASQVTISLPANYIGVDGTYYPGTVTLKPFTSKILVKDTSVLRQTLAVQVSATPVNCYGQTSNVTVNAAGGIPPYTGTGSFNVLAGTYTYTVADLRGITVSTTINITQPAAPLRLTATAGTITIYGGSTWVNLSATGGTAPYTGVLSFTNVAAGTHTYSVKDAKGCMQSVTIVITQPEPLRAFATAVNVPCFGGTGTITVTGTGGVPPYVGTGVFTMYAGSYYYKIRDAAGAVAYAPVVLIQPMAPLRANAVAGTINVFGGRTSVAVSATGGTAPYTGTSTINNVAAGTYTYTVTDANGCTATASVSITQPPSVLTVTASTAAIRCYDGTVPVTIAATGGMAPYTGTGSYVVNAGKGTAKLSFPSVVTGTYTLLYYTIGAVSSSKNYALYFSTLGTTNNGTLRVSLRQTFSPWASVTPRQTAGFGTARVDHAFIFNAPAAAEGASFSIEVNQNSGTTYIDNIAFFELDADNKPVGNNLYDFGDFENNVNNVYAYSANNNQVLEWDSTRKITRTYYYNVTDAANASVNAIVKTSQPAAPLLMNVSVAGTTVTVTATGGTAPYTGTGTFTNAANGNLTYTVTDANGCMAAKTIFVSGTRPAAKPTIDTEKLKVIVYPNPSSSLFNVWIEGNSHLQTSVSVTAADGKTIYTAEGKQQHFTLGENFAAGIYFVKVKQGNMERTVKVVKAK